MSLFKNLKYNIIFQKNNLNFKSQNLISDNFLLKLNYYKVIFFLILIYIRHDTTTNQISIIAKDISKINEK